MLFIDGETLLACGEENLIAAHEYSMKIYLHLKQGNV
jgi:hypothetical protein